MTFLKWAGGKRKLTPFIKEVLENYISPSTTGFIEPFVGGGSVFSAFKDDFERFIINDINTNLIGLYSFLKNDTHNFMKELESYFTPENNTKESFNEIKRLYNSLPDGSRQKCLIFVYLNKHGFNGMYRVNSRGQYNIPFAGYKTVNFPKNAMIDFLYSLGNVQIFNKNFLDIMDMAKDGDVVYCDPPYLSLSKTSLFSSYERGTFNLNTHQMLVEKALELVSRGVTTLISNHETDETLKLYENAFLYRIDVQRTISAKLSSRVKVPEIIAVYSPKNKNT